VTNQLLLAERERVQGKFRQHLFLWIPTAIGFLTTVGAYWEAIGRFSVNADGHSIACGSPFLGRWFTSSSDPMATAAVMCSNAAPERRLLTFVLGGIGLGLLVLVLAYIAWSKRARRISDANEIFVTPPNEPATSRIVPLCLIGVIAAALVLAGAGFAVLHASSLY
jgi:hypothetical protein